MLRVHAWKICEASQQPIRSHLRPELHPVPPRHLQRHHGCGEVPSLHGRIAERGGSHGVSHLRGRRVFLRRRRVQAMSYGDVRPSCARGRLPRLRCWIIHRQRDERRHDLHALQFRLLLPWNNERDLRALLGWKVVPEWSVHLQRLRAREAYEYDWVKQLPELRDGKSGEFDGRHGVRRLHTGALPRALRRQRMRRLPTWRTC